MSDPLADLPDDVAAAIRPHLDDLPPQIEAIGVEIAAKRDEAKSSRSSSGIETVWRDAEEAYIGIDDANRHEFTDGRWEKPMSIQGPVSTGRAPKGSEHKSTVFLRLTSRYVDAGAAKLGEILLPADDKAFSFHEMPVPELIEAKEDKRQVVHDGMGNVPLTRPAGPGDAAPPPQPGQAGPQGPPPPVPLTVRDLAIEKIEMARKRAKAAETRVYDWMVEGQYVAEVRKVIFDAARIGVGVLKGPVPKSKRVMALIENGDDVQLMIKDKIVPASVWVDPWNIFPDPACGENIHDGDYIFERDHMSARQVRALKKLPGYIESQIDKVLEEGPDKVAKDGEDRGSRVVKNKGRFEVWYFYGTLSKDEMAAIDAAAGNKSSVDDPDVEEVNAIVTLINDSVVKAVLNPLDSGEFPYDSMPWQRRSQSWAGVGVAEQMKTPQRVTNAALRAMLNNAGKSAGSQIVVDRATIRPADGNWTLTPDKIWFSTAEGADVSKAFLAVEIPNMTDQLMKIVEFGQQAAEETTSIPLITQGQSGATTPDTFGAAQLQNNNANQLLRSIGYAFDDYITEPTVRRYYEWLLLDADVPNEEKGEWQINAHGSAALVERAIQDQSIAQMGAMAANPAYGVDPKKWATEFIKSKKLDPKTMQYTKEEQELMAAAPPPDPPVVAAAKVSADTQLKLGVMKQQTDQQTAQAEAQVEQAAQVLEGHKTAVGATVALHQTEMAHQRALLEYSNRMNVSLSQVKAELAKTAMQLQTERQLNAENNAIDLHKHRNPQPPRGPRGPRPAVQAPGRAANGQAASQVVQ